MARFRALGADCVTAEQLRPTRGRLLLYAARTLTDAEALRAAERPLVSDDASPDPAVMGAAAREVGLRLGYPECCVESFARRAERTFRSGISEDYAAAREQWEPAPDARLNHFLFSARVLLISFTPCSYHCPAARAQAQAILSALEQEEAGASAELLGALARTVIVGPDHGRAIVTRIVDGRIEEAVPPLAPGRPPESASQRDVELARACLGARVREDGTVKLKSVEPERRPVVLRFTAETRADSIAGLGAP